MFTRGSVFDSSDVSASQQSVLTNVTAIIPDHPNDNLPYIAESTKVLLDPILPQVEQSKAIETTEASQVTPKVIQVKGASEDNTFEPEMVKPQSPAAAGIPESRVPKPSTGNPYGKPPAVKQFRPPAPASAPNKAGNVGKPSANNAKKPVKKTVGAAPVTSGAQVPPKRPPNSCNQKPLSQDNSPASATPRGKSKGNETARSKDNSKAGKSKPVTESNNNDVEYSENVDDRDPRYDTFWDRNYENEELDTMIDEIMKNTPHPSMTLSLKSNNGDGNEEKKKDKKHTKASREQFEKEMRKSHDGKTFRQVGSLNTFFIFSSDSSKTPEINESLPVKNNVL